MDKYEIQDLPSFVQKVLSIGTIRELDRAIERGESGRAQQKKLNNLLKQIDYEPKEGEEEEKYELAPYPTWILKVMMVGVRWELNRLDERADEDPEKARVITLLYRLKDEEHERPIPRSF